MDNESCEIDNNDENYANNANDYDAVDNKIDEINNEILEKISITNRSLLILNDFPQIHNNLKIFNER